MMQHNVNIVAWKNAYRMREAAELRRRLVKAEKEVKVLRRLLDDTRSREAHLLAHIWEREQA